VKIPCEECIGLVSCKIRLRKTIDPPDVTTFSISIDCSRLQNYMLSVQTIEETNHARNVLGVSTLWFN